MFIAWHLFSFFHNSNVNIKWLHDIETHLQNLLTYKAQLRITLFNINIITFLVCARHVLIVDSYCANLMLQAIYWENQNLILNNLKLAEQRGTSMFKIYIIDDLGQ